MRITDLFPSISCYKFSNKICHYERKKINGIPGRMRNPLIGFADQSSLSVDPQRNRLIEIRYGQVTAVSRTVFGFMGLGGNDVVMVSDTSTKHSMMSFLEAVRDANPAGDICVILDNARIHHARDVYCSLPT
jgi:hypothetical protein